jgi:hypothetical protein
MKNLKKGIPEFIPFKNFFFFDFLDLYLSSDYFYFFYLLAKAATSLTEISFPPSIIKRSTTLRNSRIFPVQS